MLTKSKLLKNLNFILGVLNKSDIWTIHLAVSRHSDHLEADKAKGVEKNNRGGGQGVALFRTCLSDIQKFALNKEYEFCFLNFFYKNDIRDVDSTADLVLVLLVSGTLVPGTLVPTGT